MNELFTKESGSEDYITFFNDGTLGVWIDPEDSYDNSIDLDKTETRELFNAMVKYYKREEIGQAVDSLRGGCHE